METHTQMRRRRPLAENLSTITLRHVGVSFVAAPRRLVEKGAVTSVRRGDELQRRPSAVLRLRSCRTGKAASIARSAGMMSSPMHDGAVSPRFRYVYQHAIQNQVEEGVQWLTW